MLDIDGKQIEIGRSVVTVKQRKRGVYRVLEQRGESLILDPVRAVPGYPSLNAKRRYVVTVQETEMWVVASSFASDERPSYSNEPEIVPAVTVESLKLNVFISRNIIAEFEDLQAALEPENLTCDGECSPQQVAIKRKKIRSKWALLEKYIGYKVQA